MTANGCFPCGSAVVGSPVTPSPIIQNQLEWYIDAVNGNDAAQGDTPATAIASWREYRRRVGPIPYYDADVDINILSALPEPLADVHFMMFDGSIPRILGSVTSTLYSGTLSGVTAQSPAGQQRLEFMDAGIGDFAPFVGNRLRITSGGSSGAIGWIGRRLAATTAAMSQTAIIDPTTSPPGFFAIPSTPGVGATFDIEELATVEGIDLELSRFGGTGGLDITDGVISDLTVDSPNASVHLGNAIGALGWSFMRSSLTGGGQGWSRSHCFFNAAHLDCNGFNFATFVELMQACLIRSSVGDVFFVANSSSANMSGLAQGCEIRVITGGLAMPSTLGVWNSPSDGIAVEDGTRVYATGLLWGDGNAGAGLQTVAGANIVYDVSSKPIVTGAVDTTINNINIAYAGIPSFSVAAGCGIVAKIP